MEIANGDYIDNKHDKMIKCGNWSVCVRLSMQHCAPIISLIFISLSDHLHADCWSICKRMVQSVTKVYVSWISNCYKRRLIIISMSNFLARPESQTANCIWWEKQLVQPTSMTESTWYCVIKDQSVINAERDRSSSYSPEKKTCLDQTYVNNNSLCKNVE